MSMNQVEENRLEGDELVDDLAYEQRITKYQRQDEIDDKKEIDQNQNNDENFNVFQGFAKQPETEEGQIKYKSVREMGDHPPPLKRVRSSEELLIDFKENQKILTSLSSNIDDLFKKISSLTQQVTTQILPELKSTNSLSAKISEEEKSEVKMEYQKLVLPEEMQYKSKNFDLNLNNFEYQDDGLSMRHFQTGRSLGHGKFGQVIQCRHIETGCMFAMKKIFKSIIEKYDMHEQLLIQLEASKRMNHPNIVQYYSSFTDEFHIFLLMEYAHGQKLTKKFKSSEKQVKKIIRQAISSLHHMHEKGVAHRDLKPENMIMGESGLLKIFDFGWSHLIDKNEKMDIVCGTLDYVCPQMVNNEKYSKEVDIWSIGVLTYELLFGKAPFKGQNKKQTFEKVKEMNLEFPEEIEVSEDAIDFMKKILKVEGERISLQEAEKHKFLQVEEENNQIIDDCVLQ